MKQDNEFNNLSPEEKLKAENELLKLKLNAEFGMIDMGTPPDDKLNNEWLNHIYNFEKQYAENKKIKVYDFIGRPAFKKIDELNKELVSLELNRLMEMLNDAYIRLDTVCDYDDEVIYRFITEEFFDVETDDIKIPGMIHCFSYEEFHPNHQYEIERLAKEFVTTLIKKEWDDFTNTILMAETISFNDRVFDRNEFLEFIKAFQNKNQKMKLIKFNIKSVSLDPDKGTGQLDGFIKYKLKDSKEISEGPVHFEFIPDVEYRSISKVVIPGFNGWHNI